MAMRPLLECLQPTHVLRVIKGVSLFRISIPHVNYATSANNFRGDCIVEQSFGDCS